MKAPASALQSLNQEVRGHGQIILDRRAYSSQDLAYTPARGLKIVLDHELESRGGSKLRPGIDSSNFEQLAAVIREQVASSSWLQEEQRR